MLNKVLWSTVILLIIAVNSARFFQLEEIPNGFHVDEISSALSLQCLATEGVDVYGAKWPLYAHLRYGTPHPPTYVYPGILWVKAFGFKEGTVRAYTALVFTVGLLGLFLLGRVMGGNVCGLIAMLAGSISPWTWISSRIAYESLWGAIFIIFALLFYFRSRKIPVILSAVCFSLSMYSYPPMRLFVPLLLLILAMYEVTEKRLNGRTMIVFLTALFIVSIPLIIKTLNGELMSRFSQISVFSLPQDILPAFLQNYALHFSPEYLFTQGPPFYVHSTRHFGVLSWLDILAIPFLLWLLFAKKHRKLTILLVIAYLAGIIPSALTNEELPHTLRSSGSWPFLCLLTGLSLAHVIQKWKPFLLPITLTAGVFAFVFLRTFFTIYPAESSGMFDPWSKKQAVSAVTEEDWMNFVYIHRYRDLHARYYLMLYHKDSCTDARLKWDNMKKYLQAKGLY